MLNVLLLSVEVAPLSKVGGLADVAGSLSKALARRGHDVRIMTPLHGHPDLSRYQPRLLARLSAGRLAVGDECSLWQVALDGVPTYLIESAPHFDRPAIYGHDDDNERWLFFCDAALAAAPLLDWRPDVIHLNEWHTAFIASRLVGGLAHPWRDVGRLYTIHNLAIHGAFDAAFAADNALPERAFVSPVAGVWPHSGMAQGILWADMINTVSPTYAKEILTPEFGFGLDPLLRHRADRLTGILNGIDYDVFDPATDPLLAAHYDTATLDKRAANKEALQRRVGLSLAPDVPLFGMVSRLYYQKGVELAEAALAPLLAAGKVQLVVLGTGDEEYHRSLTELQARHPQQAHVALTFDAALAQMIYAGADLFLMPSRFEPCGLGQMIALRYGAVPVVRRTGGLTDSVVDATPDLSAGTGFVFEAATVEALAEAVGRALDAYRRPDQWRALVRRGMAVDFSWDNAVLQYEDAYRRAQQLAMSRGG